MIGIVQLFLADQINSHSTVQTIMVDWIIWIAMHGNLFIIWLLYLLLNVYIMLSGDDFGWLYN